MTGRGPIMTERCNAGGNEWCCVRPTRRRGLCGGHSCQVPEDGKLRPLRYQTYGGRPRQKDRPCGFEGCANMGRWSGLCAGHAKQKREGKALRPLRKWEPHPYLPGWGKPWTFEGSGYAYTATQGGPKSGGVKRLEHRVVMEHVIGRPLLPHENIHHLNGVRDDNRPENLELWSTMQPTGQSVSDKVRFAWEIIALYDPTHTAYTQPHG